MAKTLSGKSTESFGKPDGVNAIEIDAFGGGLPCRDFPKRSEYFISGTEPTKDCLVQKTLDGKEYFVFAEFDPVSTDGRNRWQEGIDTWAKTQDSKYQVPKELLNEPTKDPDDIKINIKKPSHKTRIDFSFETEADIETGRKVKKVEFYIDGSIRDVKTDGDKNVKFNFTFSPANRGKHKIKIKAYNEANKDSESEIEVSVDEDWKD
jgi:hypothetical protein